MMPAEGPAGKPICGECQLVIDSTHAVTGGRKRSELFVLSLQDVFQITVSQFLRFNSLVVATLFWETEC